MNNNRTFTGERMAPMVEDRLRSAKHLAAQACRDFMSYGEKGYTPQLLDAINKATSETEIRDLLRKARAAK